ncbi:MAG: 4Fe-4S binding protein [Elusimicrobia bacterium]|nr:4Fe-4S binding protein [Elusimicrobiota bacterium]
MVKRLTLKPERCKSCSLCINFCPDSALDYSLEFNELGHRPIKWKGECRLCGTCFTVCPDNVFEIIDDKKALER